ncbi:S-methyl-5-thioribose-1-phosphate isomerase [Thermosulfuriphilus sp.]
MNHQGLSLDIITPISWKGDYLLMLDQRLLPAKERWLKLRALRDVHRAIKDMVIRGAPAIGIAAAFGMVLAAKAAAKRPKAFFDHLEEAASFLATARPTAVNLFWAISRMMTLAASHKEAPVEEVIRQLEAEALAIWREDVAANRAMGRAGAELIADEATILTHCNAGALATGGYGTAIGVIRAAAEAGKKIRVFADETRPYLQGARLTAWELKKVGLPVSVITDSTAGYLMALGKINAVVVGADRVAANGDVANKIGTYTLAVLAQRHRIPFYVAAPRSTIDLETPNGQAIPIERRGPEEVHYCGRRRMTPEGVEALNLAFDVTPAELITAIITEVGVLWPPYGPAIRAAIEGE